MRYRIPIQEMISVWQNVDVVIETEDSKSEIMRHIEDGNLMSKYHCEYTCQEIMYETEEILDHDYGHITKEDIEELD